MMNIPNSFLCLLSESTRRTFIRWMDMMDNQLEFWRPNLGVEVHGENHCQRVLFHALHIGEQLGLNAEEMETLAHAAIFHDTRRKDNYLDKGHGMRAAKYYEAFCRSEGIRFSKIAWVLMAYHDQDDAMGVAYMEEHAEEQLEEWLLLFKIFKDSDGLDRLRIGPWGLNPAFLRTEEARGMIELASKLMLATMPVQLYERAKKQSRAYAARISKGF